MVQNLRCFSWGWLLPDGIPLWKDETLGCLGGFWLGVTWATAVWLCSCNPRQKVPDSLALFLFGNSGGGGSKGAKSFNIPKTNNQKDLQRTKKENQTPTKTGKHSKQKPRPTSGAVGQSTALESLGISRQRAESQAEAGLVPQSLVRWPFFLDLFLAFSRFLKKLICYLTLFLL